MIVPYTLPLDLLEVFQGSFSLIFAIISIFVGLRILFKYFEYKRRELILVGISWIGIASPWIPDSINFIMILGFSSILTEEAYLIIGNVFMPFFIICWLIVITDFLYKTKQKLILILCLIWTVIFEMIFFTLLFTDSTLVGTFLGPFHVEFGDFITFTLLFTIVVLLISGLLFARESLKSEDKEIKLKGKFLIVAFLSFTIGAILDSSISLIPITVVITRLILISSSIEFYIGFILPKWVKKFLIKELERQ